MIVNEKLIRKTHSKDAESIWMVERGLESPKDDEEVILTSERRDPAGSHFFLKSQNNFLTSADMRNCKH